jgi:four helix bundle protein
MGKNELEARTKGFALRVIQFVSEFPKNNLGHVLSSQLLRSATSIGANYREANRAESRNDFIHKIGVVEKEAAETLYWLELCTGAHVGDQMECIWLLGEANELVSIFVTIGKKAKLGRAFSPEIKSREH